MPEPQILPPDPKPGPAGLAQLGARLGAAWAQPRWRKALVIAMLSDALAFGMVLLPMAQWTVDIATAAALFAVLGFRPALLPALAVEVWPALELFPAWTLAVAALAAWDLKKEDAGGTHP